MFVTVIPLISSLSPVSPRVSQAKSHSSTEPNDPPSKPALNIIDVNIVGTLYTFKLAVHYFRKQADDEPRDRCFIITGSITAWIDSPVSSSLES